MTRMLPLGRFIQVSLLSNIHMFFCVLLWKNILDLIHIVFKISYPHYNYVTLCNFHSAIFTRNFSIFITIANFLLFPTKKVPLDMVLCNKV